MTFLAPNQQSVPAGNTFLYYSYILLTQEDKPIVCHSVWVGLDNNHRSRSQYCAIMVAMCSVYLIQEVWILHPYKQEATVFNRCGIELVRGSYQTDPVDQVCVLNSFYMKTTRRTWIEAIWTEFSRLQLRLFIQILFIFLVATHKTCATRCILCSNPSKITISLSFSKTGIVMKNTTPSCSLFILHTLLALLPHSLNSLAHCCKSFCLTWSWIFNSFLLSCCPWSKTGSYSFTIKSRSGWGQREMHLLCLCNCFWLLSHQKGKLVWDAEDTVTVPL